MSKVKKVESVKESREKELKLMQKRLEELETYKYGRNEDGTRDYDARDKYYSLPEFARKSVDKEIWDLKDKIRKFGSTQEGIKNDLRKSIMNVLKYYGVEDKLLEIEESFNRYKENDRLESLLEELSIKIANEVDWETRKYNY